MLNKLKIYTVISLIIGMISCMLFGVTAFSVYNSVTINKNFKRVVDVNDSNAYMTNAAWLC